MTPTEFADEFKSPENKRTIAKTDIEGLAHEIWATAQLMPGEGIEDGVERILSILRKWQEENKMNGKGVKSDPYNYVFAQGYACAVAALIRLNGCVTTDAKELFRAGLRMAVLDTYELDENDIDLFKKYQEELK